MAVLGKITYKMIIVKDQDHKVKSDLKSRSKITGLEMILDQDHLKSDLRSKITSSHRLLVECKPLEIFLLTQL